MGLNPPGYKSYLRLPILHDIENYINPQSFGDDMQLWMTTSYLILLLFVWYIIYRRQIISLIIGRQKFECLRCGHCCRLLVKLSKDDIARLGKALKPDYIIKVHGITYLKQKNSYCPFLSIRKGQASCDVYKLRPEICRNFPKLKMWKLKALDYRCKELKIPKYLL
jgi:Fe-S-cluster containining protein